MLVRRPCYFSPTAVPLIYHQAIQIKPQGKRKHSIILFLIYYIDAMNMQFAASFVIGSIFTCDRILFGTENEGMPLQLSPPLQQI